MMAATAVRNALAAGAAALVMAFSQMDANPSLFFHDRFFVNNRSLDEQFGGKTMWITGASSGIGAELAMQLSRHGVNLILSARPSDRLNLVAEECRRRASHRGNGTVTVVPADFSADILDLEATIDTVLSAIVGGECLDFVVLNAGRGQLRPSSLTKHDVTEQLFKLNTLAPIAVTQILLERGALRENAGRHLVITSSVGAKFGVPLSASYSASKHALHGYYNSLRAELPWLRVDLICPGSTDAHFHQSHIGGSRGATTLKTDATKKPSKKLKMSTSRCSELFISSMTMTHRQGGEYWIAEHPVLSGLYLNQVMPSLFQWTLSQVGPLRVKAWEEGLDLYDPSTWKQMKRRRNED